MPPTDPLIYRFYELVMVNGPAWKALIEEEFGDGIMSAIDFDVKIQRFPHPKGDRVKITMSGKFLPYKYYGAEQGILVDWLGLVVPAMRGRAPRSGGIDPGIAGVRTLSIGAAGRIGLLQLHR